MTRAFDVGRVCVFGSKFKMETDTTQTKIFIGGLSYQTSSERLREIFAKYGEMIEVCKPIFGSVSARTVERNVAVPRRCLLGW